MYIGAKAIMGDEGQMRYEAVSVSNSLKLLSYSNKANL